MDAMTPKERMLAAYRKREVDRPPVAPELWSYVPARVMGVSMIEFERMPLWKAFQRTFAHYDCDGWGCVAPRMFQPEGVERETTRKTHPDGSVETRYVTRHAGREFVQRTTVSPAEPSWVNERVLKNLEDWPVWEPLIFTDPRLADWIPVEEAIEAVGEDYLLEVNGPLPFLDAYGCQREGGLEQVVMDVMEHESLFDEIQRRYITWCRAYVREAFRRTSGEVLFIGCGWSCNSVLGPRLWRRWDKPVIAAMAEEAHACGRLVHIHFHGKCMETLSELVESEVDCICPFERPPGGDVTDLRAVRKIMEGRTTFNGNVQTVETLIRGTPQDVRHEVEEIAAAWEGAKGWIIGTGDQVGGDTPEENIRTLIAAGKDAGRNGCRC